MPDEMLSFLAGGSAPGLVKPVAYDTIEAPKIENSEIRKIAHDVQMTLPTSEKMVEWCKDYLWALGCCHGSVDHEWEVVERRIQNQENAKHRRSQTECEKAIYRLCT